MHIKGDDDREKLSGAEYASAQLEGGPQFELDDY